MKILEFHIGIAYGTAKTFMVPIGATVCGAAYIRGKGVLLIAQLPSHQNQEICELRQFVMQTADETVNGQYVASAARPDGGHCYHIFELPRPAIADVVGR
jgi:hypothetical protein